MRVYLLLDAQLAEQPALLANTSFLKEKITLMCLTETLFQHLGPAADRAVPFAAIATAYFTRAAPYLLILSPP